MTTDARPRRTFDRSSLLAYAGTGAAIAFIAAMTFGAIDSPTDHRNWVASSQVETTRLVSAATPGDAPTIR